MYLLLKCIDKVTKKYAIVARLENIHDISEQIENRIKDGCPLWSLKVVEEIPFEFKCAVKYGEDLRNTGAK